MITGKCLSCGKIKHLRNDGKCVLCAVRLVAQPEPAEIVEEAGVKRIKDVMKNKKKGGLTK